MKKYAFLIGWIAHNEGAAFEDTGIQCNEDLEKLYKQNSPHVDSVIIEARSEEEAYDKGYRWAFFSNWTANDTMSTLIEESAPQAF